MNPHFVFNSLNSIQNFILSNDIEKAVTYLGTLGSLIRINLEHVSKEYISLSEEVKFIEKYIEIEKMRFKEELVISTVVKITDTDVTILPPMLIQPLIENSIKYRNRSSNHKGRIQIEFCLENNLMTVSVTDNGVGRTNSKINLSTPHTSMGLDLISKRLSLLNEKFETTDFQILITDLYLNGTPSGTKVQVNIPQIYFKN
jgi:LytS/YehU family sensor histidine kinase